MTSNSNTTRVSAVLGGACDTASVAALAYLVISRVFYDDLGVGQEFGADRFALLIIAAMLVVLRRLSARMDPRLTLASFAVLAASAAGLAILPAVNIQIADRLRSALVPVKSALFDTIHQTYTPRAIHRLDDRYGYVQIPNSTDSERGRGFTASYTIDADGYRTMPRPERPRATVVFLGDSFTYGWGVNDNQTFPYVLATEHWSDIRVINAGVEGWGLTQFYLAVTDMLARPPFPTVVIVAIIEDDLRRSHLRPPLIAGQRRRLEWIDGTFVPRDLRSAPASVAETRGLVEQEAELAAATITAMAVAARAKGVPLATVLLDGGKPFPPAFVYGLGRSGVPTLDLTNLGQTSLPYDVHPDAAGYRTIAAAIAASHLATMVYEHASDHEGSR